MNINNFEDAIDKKILKRGYDYYIEGNVYENYNKEDNVYTFDVEGSEDYQVIVEFYKDEIVNSYCDCPYDFGPICKHEVAVYYELRDVFNNKSMNKESNRPKIKDILNALSKEELVNIILDITKQNKVLKNNIIFKYAKDNDNDGVVKKFERLVNSVIDKYIYKDGYIEYREIDSFFNNMYDVLEDASKIKDVVLGIDITFSILKEVMESFNYEYDAEGESSCFFSSTIDVLLKFVEKSKELDRNKRGNIFNKLLNEYNNRYFNNWQEYRFDILWMCINFDDIEEFREKLKLKIENCITKSDDDNYNKEIYLKMLFTIIENNGTKEEKQNFIIKNLNFTYFRELLINEYIEKEKYDEVIQLTLDAEKQDENLKWRKNNKWKEFRYIAYKGISKKEEQQKLAKELLFDGNFKYYKELKELANGRKEEFYNELKQELKKSTYYWRTQDIFINIILEENDLDELMEFVRKNPSYIEEYAKLLIDNFRSEVLDIYKDYIKSKASISTNRKDYKIVCRIIKNYKNICNENAKEVIDELKDTYKRRSAFVDELYKLK